MKNSTNLTLAGGVFALFIAMGVGRFAYTPILPLMQHAVGFSSLVAGNIASANYLGYLAGAILASIIPWGNQRGYYLKVSIIISLVTTCLMGLTNSLIFWLAIRFISGCSSSVTFVLSSSVIIDLLNREHKQTLIGLFYSGVGLGIAFTGLAVPWLNSYFGWQGAWIGLAVISSFFAVIPLVGISKHNSIGTASSSTDKAMQNESISVSSLIVAYGLQGFGYVITGTFLVAILRDMFEATFISSSSWVIVGLAAAPSCYLWAQLANRIGYTNGLMAAYILQAVAVILPVFKPDIAGALIGSLFFGGTFMGITTMANALIRNLKPENSSKFIGYLTAAYGLGQILGPLAAGYLFDLTNSFNVPLTIAFAALILGLAILMAGSVFKRRISS